MTRTGPDTPKSVVVRESITGPVNHRDASGSSGSHWKNPPTLIPVPAISDRPPFRAHDNPYSRTSNTLVPKHGRPGNPNVRQTILAKAAHGYGTGADPPARKRQKLDANISSGPSLNGASSSLVRRPAPRSDTSEPDIQMIEPSRTMNKRSDPVPNDAEIIDIGTSSDDLGERVSHTVKSWSPDPILLAPPVPSRRGIHAFETHPTQYSLSTSKKGKGRAKEPPESVVQGSEGLEEIEDFPPEPIRRPSSTKKSPSIPKNIVQDRKVFFESTPTPAPAPAATRHPIKDTVQVDLITRSVVGQMKKKGEGARRNTCVSDNVGMSSSNFLNSPRGKEETQVLPLEALCIGHHLCRHSDSAPLKLEYEIAQHTIKVMSGETPLERIEFRLDKDVCATTIVNDGDVPLRDNVVVQFITKQGQEWEKVERRYKGFKGGGKRGKEALTFLFSTAKDRGFSITGYQEFVIGIRRPFEKSVVQVVRPSQGRTIWEFASRCAEMFEQTESRSGKEDRSECTVDEPSILARPVTHFSESIRPDGDSGPSTLHRRSMRQSALRTLKTPSPPPPLAPLEPDEVILMYPPTGTGALSIMHSDLRRLQPEEYLNDTLIEFGLKLWLDDLRVKNPSLADQIHVFSSFFYKKLNNRKNPLEGYKSVRKWTSKVDLFKKKYVIVPINENIHWYLAVIYEPGRTLEPPLPLDHPTNARVTRKRKQTQGLAEVDVKNVVVSEPALTEVSLERSRFFMEASEGEAEADTSSTDATRATTPSTTRDEEMMIDKSCSIMVPSTTSSDGQVRDSSPLQDLAYPSSDNMDVDVDIAADVVPNPTGGVAEAPDSSASASLSVIPASQFYGSVSKQGEVKPVVIADNEDSGEDQQQEAEVVDMLAVTQSPNGDWPAQTYILTLDSLGSRHPQAIKVLKQYLISEAKDKRNFDEVRDAVGKQVQVPVQPNTWDCGIYLLHFVKVFMSAPSEFMDQILSTRGTMLSAERKRMWQDHEIPQFRDHLKSRIMQLSEEWKAEKSVREERVNRRRSVEMVEMEVLSSEGEVDIVEDHPSVKSAPGPRQKRPATRLRG